MYKKYQNIAIYYFSGTGNARFAAEKIASFAKQKNIPVYISNIDTKESYDKHINDNSLIVFCYPTHGFNAPPIVLRFISSFPRCKASVLLLNTRAGMKLFSIHTPGIGGIALWLPSIILKIKGYKCVGWQSLDMPSNWISLHPGLREKSIAFIKNRCENSLAGMTEKAFSGKIVLNGLIWLPIDILVIPVTIAYYCYGRFALAKTFYANSNCTNCGLCIKNCPVEAVIEKSARPYWKFKCESCMRCMNTCPERAIETGHGFTFILWWLVFSGIPYFIISRIEKHEVISHESIQNYYSIISNAIILITGLIITFLYYELLHQLLKLKFFNRIITFTSLTHYKFWRRYFFKRRRNDKY
jgi:ferredoxin